MFKGRRIIFLGSRCSPGDAHFYETRNNQNGLVGRTWSSTAKMKNTAKWGTSMCEVSLTQLTEKKVHFSVK